MSTTPTSPPTPIVAEPKKRGLWYRLYHGETAFDFMGRKKIWFAVSALVILVGFASLYARGLNLGIDFKGGTAWDVTTRSMSVNKARDAVRPVGLAEAKIQVIGQGASRVVRVQHDLKCSEEAEQAKCTDITDRLAKAAGVKSSDVSINTVGPSWGKDITKKAERALLFFFIAVALYISLRFEWKMAASALAAVVHDILVTVGIYSLSGFAVSPATVIAFLTILGFSLYDTIVVFDKVEENTRGLAASGRMTYADTVNLSMNQVLMRSLNTSLVAILPVLSVLIIGAYVLGATALEDFGLALSIGLLTGAYSSIFIASPLLAVLKEREPRYASIRQRVMSRGGAGMVPLTPAAAAAAGMGTLGGEPRDQLPGRAGGTGSGGGGSSGAKATTPRPAGQRPGAGRPAPRPRKKGRRR
ncbi:MAG: preprotein translocase subunit SecF [Acidimicrobiaceae bacterium]|nr:preprotein translocase subunit SecF [Acidimicrobiaceae bacterium]